MTRRFGLLISRSVQTAYTTAVRCIWIIFAAVTIVAGARLHSQESSCPIPAAAEAQPWLNSSYTPQCRTKFVLDHLGGQENKIRFIEGYFGPGGRGGLAELGLKAGGTADGPAGIRGLKNATAFPTPLTVAASFDPTIAREFGDILGEEFASAGITTMFGPAMDMPRTWHFGRVTEGFGEDPYLAGTIAAAEVESIQKHHVVATIKHFTAYNQEQGRTGEQPIGGRPGVNEIISERALRELYLPAFRSAAQVGHAGGVMCSFPRINGVYACENPHTLGILKNEWKFDGSVVQDFPDAQRSIIPALVAGLDLGMKAPGRDMFGQPAFAGEESLAEGVRYGRVSSERIDDLVTRLLLPNFRIGVFDLPQQSHPDDVSTPERRRRAAQVVSAGAVLLKNNNQLLPLRNVKSIALIGPQATEGAIVTEQGSPFVPPAHLVSVRSALEARAGDGVRVVFSPGTHGIGPLPAIPGSNLKDFNGQTGITAEYFADPSCQVKGDPIFTESSSTIDLAAAPKSPLLPKNLQWCVRYRGMFTAPSSGVHQFTLTGSGEGRLFINGVLKAEFMRDDMDDTATTSLQMGQGESVAIEVRYSPRTALVPQVVSGAGMGVPVGLHVSLGWSGPDSLMSDAVSAAKAADVAIVVVGHRVGEGMDRLHLVLPGDQNELIEAVAKANPHTIVVLNTGGAVTMPWLGDVSSVLETWLPGDADGPATASLLFGDAEPGGRLPITFPRDETQGPATKESQYPGTTDSNGSLDTAHFDEDIFVGYRFWDKANQTPLFPFGFGLSYTTFRSNVLSLSRNKDGGVTLDVAVENTGKRAGNQVVQVYLEFPKAAGEPPKQLKQFAKIALDPGRREILKINVPADAFLYWNTDHGKWEAATGLYDILVGNSSRDIFWKGDVRR